MRLSQSSAHRCPASVARPADPSSTRRWQVEEELNKQLAAFRDGTGKDVEFLLDLNFNFKTEGTSASSVRWSGTG